jgi:hypothetical protein
VFDAFPFEEWSDKITTFWTFGNEGSTGTIILTVLGCILMVVTLIGWVVQEQKALDKRAAKLREAMGSGGGHTTGSEGA